MYMVTGHYTSCVRKQDMNIIRQRNVVSTLNKSCKDMNIIALLKRLIVKCVKHILKSR